MFLRAATILSATGSLALLASAARAQATFEVGPRLGLNLATFHFDQARSGTTGYRAGFEVGLVGCAGFGRFALQPGLLFSQKGFTYQNEVDVRTANNLPIGGEMMGKTQLNYLTLPLNVAYRQNPDGQGWQVFAGPYVGLLFSGKYESTTTVSGSTVGSQSGKITPVANEAPDFDAYARRFDAGLQGGLGYRHRALLLELGYSLGLRDIAARYTYNSTPVSSRPYYNRAFQASLTYLFKSKG